MVTNRLTLCKFLNLLKHLYRVLLIITKVKFNFVQQKQVVTDVERQHNFRNLNLVLISIQRYFLGCFLLF